MTLPELEASLSAPQPPPALSPALAALWHDARGEWDRAQQCAQDDEGAKDACAWVHAYLHRKEGDPGNAAYWYRRAGKPVPASTLPLPEEWRAIAAELLSPTNR